MGSASVEAEATNSESIFLNQDEVEEFDLTYEELIRNIIKITDEMMPDMKILADRLVELLNYNVLGGKKIRGLMVPVMYKSLVKNPSKEDMKLAYILGWIMEMLQGASLVADDLMDNSETRRGKPCWYKLKDVGKMAVNDCLLIELLAYKILRVFFGDKPYFLDLNDILRDNVQKTIFGQGLDFQTGQCERQNIVEEFTMERYSLIVKYKTSFYTMVLPILSAMAMAEKHRDKETVQQVEDLLLDIGHYFQVQDDYLDCFGDDGVTGKIGTDIQDNKCSWLFVQAAKLCNPEELKCLLENYGYDDQKKINRVKRLYKDLDLIRVYEEFQEEAYTTIIGKIESLPKEIPQDVFRELFMKIYQRFK